jgi:hypothetical protein
LKDPKCPLTGKAFDALGVQFENIVVDMYQILLKSGDISFHREIRTSDIKQATITRINAMFDDKLSLNEKKHQYNAMIKVIIALVEVVKDDSLFSDIQKRIDKKQSVDIIDALVAIMTDPNRPMSVNLTKLVTAWQAVPGVVIVL